MSTLLLRGGMDAGGARLDLRTDAEAGVIVDAAAELEPREGEEVLECAGMVLLPAPAEPHAHLDKALSADRAPNPAGDLLGAIEAWHAHYPMLEEGEILSRARRAAHELVAHGATAIRSHVDVGSGIGLSAVRALLALRAELHADGLAELQVCALVAPPLAAAAGEPHRALLREAMALGADVVGGCPHLDDDPVGATSCALDVAEELGRPIDLHTDETLNAAMLALPDYARMVSERRFAHGATASHCVSLGVQPSDVQQDVAHAVARAGMAIVTLPQTNLGLQARGWDVAPPRGLTAVRPLLDAGVTVAGGADNVRDPFNCVGRADPLETAALLVMAAHLTPAEAWEAVSTSARRALGLPTTDLAPGAPAEVLAIRGIALDDAIARASEHRFVVHHGRCVARSEVSAALMPLSSSVPVLT